MNTNDLRFMKTEKVIYDTYVKLKKQNNGGLVKLSDICKEGMINRATFYKHYETLEIFEKQAQERFVREIIQNFPYKEKLFTNTDEFIQQLIIAFVSVADKIDFWFSNNRLAIVEIIGNEILKVYENENLSDEQILKLKFCLGGTSYILMKNIAPDQVNQIIEMIKTVL